MQKSINTAFLIIALFATSFSQGKGKINWVDFEEAMELNKQNGKPIFIDMYTSWCGYCKKMDAETFSDKNVADYINEHFIAVKFDAESKKPVRYKDTVYTNNRNGQVDANGRPAKGKSHSLAEILLNGRMAYPTVVYMVPEKDIVAPVPGYMTIDKIEPYLLFFSEKVYEGNLFDAFSKGLNAKRIGQ